MIYKIIPILKHRLWGGNLLPLIFDKSNNDIIGEAWVLSCINNDNCLLDKSNKTLLDLFNENKDIVAKGYKGDFPILIKLIDAQKDLSIQVHPSIKTEFWYVLNKQPSTLYMGFNKDTNRDEIEKALNNSSLPQYLNKVDVVYGSRYLINPGTIHAINAGTFLIEIQQSADITYRLYDYDRIDSNGQKRPLHINESLSSINYKKLDVNKYDDSNHLVSTPYFNVYKHRIEDKLDLNASDRSFNTFTVIEGNGIVKYQDQVIELNTYDTIFIPAGSGDYSIEGKLDIILTTL